MDAVWGGECGLTGSCTGVLDGGPDSPRGRGGFRFFSGPLGFLVHWF